MWSSCQGDHTISKDKGIQMSPKRLKNGMKPSVFPLNPCLVYFQTLVTALSAPMKYKRIGRGPPYLNFFGLLIFDCITRIYFCCSHHTMFKIFTLLSTITKTQGMYEGNINTIPRSHSIASGPRTPPVFKIPGSATDILPCE